ncbi:phosphoserine phosphatase [Spinactinospora alkalitolerans]|uniref:Phosphoserine phosphatase n=1 Tax=Spinactinospora alkalitolerans TaxID=687207 RepID=A0A852U0H7_9ACTN|nr:HAD family phosphatase [Spinactinospora alkalitolerans]NYE50336.1 phosphoserine phosphatase [Spinactinospora alkalitolerans]
MTFLHVFDMDGTLLNGSTASLEVAGVRGTVAELTELEQRFAGGVIDTRGFAREIHSLWRELTAAQVEEAFRASPFLTGVADVCADIRRRGERSLVITMSPDFYARHLLEFGFDEIVASRFPPPPFAEPVVPENILTPADKVRIVDEVRGREGIGPERCVAYGDSMSDAPLFRHLERTVAVNADHHLAGIARAEYRGPDLPGAYALGRELLRSP